MRLVPAIAMYLETVREIRAFAPEEVPYPIHPEAGGLLPWGTTGNGNVGYWVTSPSDDPAQWSIAVSEARGPGWFTHPGPLTNGLARHPRTTGRGFRVPDGFSERTPRLPSRWPCPSNWNASSASCHHPPSPSTCPSGEISRLEAEIGRSLPSDYRWFLETYGSGLDPAATLPSSRLPRSVEARRFTPQQERIGDWLRLVNERRPGEVPFPIWPEPGGLQPAGCTDLGSHVPLAHLER